MNYYPTVSQPLRDLILKFSRGEIPLPQFQRPFVWPVAKIRNLLDSLYRGYPIGGFYLWKPMDDTEVEDQSKAFGQQHRSGDSVENFLIDGQQRLTSLEVAFKLFTGEDKDGEELRCFLDLKADEERRAVSRLFVSYGTNKTIAWRAESADPTLIPLERLFEESVHRLRDEIRDALQNREGWDANSIDKALQRLVTAHEMLNIQVPCTTVSGVKDDVAIEVFRRLNKGGVPLPPSDLHAAELARDRAAKKVLKELRKFANQERAQRLGFGFSFAFRALVVFHTGDARFSKLRPNWVKKEGPDGRTLEQSWEKTEKAIDKALGFAERKMGWSRRALLPSANALIVLASAFDQAEFKLDSETEQLYRRWLCLTALRGIFRGAVESTINKFIKPIWKSNERPADVLLEKLRRQDRAPIMSEEFSQRARPWGPATQVMHAYFVSRGAKDWKTAEPVETLARNGDVHDAVGDLTVHHLFARNLLREWVENPDDAHRPANFALLSGVTNKEFGDDPPDDVWAILEPGDERKRAKVQFFGDDAGDKLRLDRYDEFCQWRADRLAESINEWLGM